MKRMNVFIAMVLSIVFAFSFASCKKEGEETIDIGEPDSFAVVQEDGKDVDMIKYSVSNYKIVIPSNASKTEQYAASELSEFLYKSSYCRLSIVSDDSIDYNGTQKYISIGKTSMFKRSGIEVNVSIQKESGFKILTDNKNIYICGATVNGTLFGVYKFLQYTIGFEAFTVDDVYFNNNPIVKLYDFKYDYVPTIDKTKYGAYELIGSENANNALRMFLYCSDRGWRAYEGRLMTHYCHTSYAILPPEKYSADNPTWYSNNQLCLSNDDVVNEAVKNIIVAFEENPIASSIQWGNSDNLACCSCAKCEEGYSLYGVGGVYVRFLNKLEEGINAYLQEKYNRTIIVYGLAYYAFRTPPVNYNTDGTFVAKDASVYCNSNVGMCYTPIEACFAHPLNSGCQSNKDIEREARAWAELTNHLLIYDYATLFGSYSISFNDWDSVGANAQFLANLGGEGFLTEANYESEIDPFHRLRTYLKAKLCWDATLDTDKLIKKYCDYYYGPGSNKMLEYFYEMKKHYDWISSQKGTSCSSCYDTKVAESKCWPKEELFRYKSLMENAIIDIRLAEINSNTKEEYIERVNDEYYKLMYNMMGWYSSSFSLSETLEISNKLTEYSIKWGIK